MPCCFDIFCFAVLISHALLFWHQLFAPLLDLLSPASATKARLIQLPVVFLQTYPGLIEKPTQVVFINWETPSLTDLQGGFRSKRLSSEPHCTQPGSWIRFSQPNSWNVHGTFSLSPTHQLLSLSPTHEIFRGPTEDIIHYFTLMSLELHYLDIIPKIDNFTLMSSTL